MILKLVREVFTEISTIGRLYANGVFICYILEDKDRRLDEKMSLEEIQKIKVYGKTAIPTGTYKVHITFSNKFKKMLPRLEQVKGFEGILCHPGNTSVDTEGCLLPGNIRRIDQVLESKLAFQKVYNILKEALDNKEEVTITIHK